MPGNACQGITTPNVGNRLLKVGYNYVKTMIFDIPFFRSIRN